MKEKLLRLCTLTVMPVVFVGCVQTAGTGEAEPVCPGIEKARPTGISGRAKLSHMNAVDALAGFNMRGIFVRTLPQRFKRFRHIEDQGIAISLDREKGSHGFHRLQVRVEPEKAVYDSKSGRETLLKAVDQDHLIILDFGPVMGSSGKYLEAVPIFRSDMPAMSITMDLDKIDNSSGFTDVANETYSVIAVINAYHDFWAANCRGKQQLDQIALELAFNQPRLQDDLYRRILAVESECRRERYFRWVADKFAAFDQGLTTEFPTARAPGYVRPFEIDTGRLAKDHLAYHRPHFVLPSQPDQAVYCTVRAGRLMNGGHRLMKLPYVAPLPGEEEGASITFAEYKARWYHAFKQSIVQEGQFSPYSHALHPNHARFPDAATPPSFFIVPFQQALRNGGTQQQQPAVAVAEDAEQ